VIEDQLDVIAETEIVVEDASGNPHTIRVQIGRPVPNANGDWTCAHQIIGLDGAEMTIAVDGVDSLQALRLSLEMMRVRVVEAVQRLNLRTRPGEKLFY
jgi:hypothetical protein